MQAAQEDESGTAYSKLLGLLRSPNIEAGQRHDRKRAKREQRAATKQLPKQLPSGQSKPITWQMLHRWMHLYACRVSIMDKG